MNERLFAVVAGGGTAGHVLPALVVAGALSERGEGAPVELVGSLRGLDAQLVERAGIEATLLPGRGFLRRADPAALVSNLRALVDLLRAIVRSLALVAKRRPRVLVAMGGYASVAPALAAWLFGVPVVVVNVDAVPGAANRLLARVARACAVAFPNTGLPRAVVTGAPVRPEITAVRRDSKTRRLARAELGLPEGGDVVVAFGGSLGARRINTAVLELAERWSGRAGTTLVHVTGRRDADWAAGVRAARPPAAADDLDYRQVAYEDRMALLYEAADVMVARAGANTVAELCVTGVPAILVPLPGAPSDHQRRNAEVLAGAGGALVVDDDECDGARLAGELAGLLEDRQKLSGMAAAAAALGRPDAAGAVADLAARLSTDRRAPTKEAA